MKSERVNGLRSGPSANNFLEPADDGSKRLEAHPFPRPPALLTLSPLAGVAVTAVAWKSFGPGAGLAVAGTLSFVATAALAFYRRRSAVFAQDLFRLTSSRDALRVINTEMAATIAQQGEAAERLEERYELAIASAQGCFWEMSIETGRIDISPRICHMLGYHETYCDNPFEMVVSLIDPVDRERITAAIREYLDGNSPRIDCSFPVLSKGGKIVWLNAHGLMAPESPGTPKRICGSVIDITKQREAETRMEESAMRFKLMFENLPLPMYIYNPHTLGFIDVNKAAVEHYGYSRDEFLSMALGDIRSEEDRVTLEKLLPEYEKSSATNAGIWRHLRKDGSTVLMEIITTNAGDHLGRGARLVMARDVTEQVEAQQAMEESERRFRGLFESANEGIFQSKIEGGYLRVNPALAQMYGYESPEEMLPSLTDISRCLYVDPKRRDEFKEIMDTHDSVTNFDSEIYRKDGSTIWISENARCVRNSDGSIAYYEGFVENITERKALESQREAMLAEALERADHDPLTGLLNHRAFHKRLEQECDRAQRRGTTLAVAVLDLDNFKFFNDAYGHAAGDAVLNEVAGVLRSSCRGYDVLARFGGDEFAILMPDVLPEAAVSFPARVREMMEAVGFQPEGYDVKIPLGITTGLALFPLDVSSRQEIVELADQRLRRAKYGTEQESFGERLRSNYMLSRDGFKILDALVTAVDNKDRYTLKHSEDVVLYSVQIARSLAWSDTAIEDLQLTALLHDVGKIGVPDNILRKPGKLTDEEYEAIKQHAPMGAMIVSSVPGFSRTLEGIRHHHERWDGKGYPDNLSREDIPIVARVLAVADSFSAMTTHRPYRSGMPHQKALNILKEGAGTQWDPICVAAFLRARAEASLGASVPSR
jgi:diguanylate cyclase (GGDEF)-like protein/PAS domain S-box-containing protein